MKFEIDLKDLQQYAGEVWEGNNGGGVVLEFPNARGASIIRHDFSYGSGMGLYELAVLDKHGHLDYSTPITDDVEGYLDTEEVKTYCRRIMELGE